jgi:hypothetical protein
MIVKIQTSPLSNGNKGSCNSLVNYLMKENLEGKTDELFFDYNWNSIEPQQVVQAIDSNKKKLGKDDAKYYSIILAPSKEEIQAILKLGDIVSKTEALKQYTSAFMDEYALNFNRNGLNSGADLVYFAKIEEERVYKGTDKEVKWGDEKSGTQKEGNQDHIHIVVSRKDVTQRLKLSPKTNHISTNKGAVKGGFERVALFKNAEQLFDTMFEYQRPKEETFEFYNERKKENARPLTEREEREIKRLERVEEHEGTPISKALDELNHKTVKEKLRKMEEKGEKPTNNSYESAIEKQFQLEFDEYQHHAENWVSTPEPPEPKNKINLEEILKREITNHEKVELLKNLRRSKINESNQDEDKAITAAIMEFREKYNNKYMDFKPKIKKDKGIQM